MSQLKGAARAKAQDRKEFHMFKDWVGEAGEATGASGLQSCTDPDLSN